MSLRKCDLYRLPWSLNDNPFGWLETTDKCNIQCYGCYRKEIAGHKPLEELKADIDFFKEWRNIYHLSIAGGEPILHPNIVEIVEYTYRQGIKPLLLSNGKDLTREKLIELKKVGLLGVSFHVDSLQRREPKWNNKTEGELNELRSELSELMASVGGLHCNFGMTVYRSNFEQICDVLRWGNENIDKVHGITFIAFRTAPMDKNYEYGDALGRKVDVTELDYTLDASACEEAGLTSGDIWDKIREEFPHCRVASYLGGTHDHAAIKWLIGVQLGFKGKMFGSIGPRAMEVFQAGHHLLKGTYLTHRLKNNTPRVIFAVGLLDHTIREAHRAFWAAVIRNPTRLVSPIYTQGLNIIQAPDLLEDGRIDMCDSCPDMAVWDGKLVHSCRMDEWRLFGSYIAPYVDQTAELSKETELEIEALLRQQN